MDTPHRFEGMDKEGTGSLRVLIGEPVTKPDGHELAIFKTERGLEITVGCIVGGYSDEEVELVGFGSWSNGVSRLSQAAYSEETTIFGFRWLNDEIELLKP